VKLVANEQVVELVEFETADPALRGDMTITISLADADGGTELLAVHDGLPPGLSTSDNASESPTMRPRLGLPPRFPSPGPPLVRMSSARAAAASWSSRLLFHDVAESNQCA
jgi:hypothetical protein